MRVVLDTNVLVRATKNASGPAREVLCCLDRDEHVLVLSQYLLTELIRVLAYPRVQALHQLTDAECLEFVQSLHDAAEVIVVDDAQSLSVSPDPDDDPVIQTAVQGKANVLCTLDRHLRQEVVQDYCRQHGIDVLTDIELLEVLRQSSGDEAAS